MSDEQKNERPEEGFNIEIFNVSGEVQHTEINFDSNFEIIEFDVDGNRRC